jgi:dihydrofolate synthase/folylpolyglutamate synthase
MKAFCEGNIVQELFFTDYTEAEGFLNNVPRFTAKNPIEETRGFYEFLGDCEKGLGRIIHVAGTNGKGSVCAFLESVCIKSGYRTGMFISPHLVTTRERFVIDGEIISEAQFLEAFNWLSQKIEEYHSVNPDYSPTYFERLFFMGTYVFNKANVEVTILETGLGGRLDTTNIIKNPVLTVITEIGFDHMAYLGDTLELIAGEKAGIIKPKVPLVFCDRKSEVSQVLVEKAQKMGSKYYPVSKKDYNLKEIKQKYIDFSVRSLYDSYVSLRVKTTASYQAENGAVAFRACEVLRNECGFDRFTDDTVKDGIEGMSWNGRMEEVRDGVFIDGAHNEDGIEAFAESLKGYYGKFGGGCIIVFSVVKDKQYDKMINILGNLPMVTDYVITHIPGERGADLEKLAGLFEKYGDGHKSVYVYDTIEAAIKFALDKKGANDRVYVVGSLYLAGIVENIFKTYIRED